MYSHTPLRLFNLALFSLLLTACGSNSSEEAFLDAVQINALNVSSISLALASGNTTVGAGTVETAVVLAQLDGGGSLDVTEDVTLSSSDSAVFTVNTSGRVRAKSIDSSATLRARWADLSASLPITVSTEDLDIIMVAGPDDVAVCSSSHQFTASGEYAAGDIRDISHLVSWAESSNESLAIINDEGVLDTYGSGSVNVVADLDGISSADAVNFALSIRDNLDSISLSPSGSVTITDGDTRQFTATASYNDASPDLDITDTANWLSGNTAILGIASRDSDAGIARANQPGATTLSASCDDSNPLSSADIAVTVSAVKTLVDVEIRFNDSASDLNLEVSDSPVQLQAFLKYDDDSLGQQVTESDDIDWSARLLSGVQAEVNNNNDKGEVSFDQAGRTEIEVIYEDDTFNFSDTIVVDVD